MNQGCPQVNAVELQTVLILQFFLKFKVFIVFLEDEVEEEDCPAKDDHWEDDPRHLEKVSTLIFSILLLFTSSSRVAWRPHLFALRNWWKKVFRL